MTLKPPQSNGRHNKLYQNARWKALRLRQLQADPLCKMCREVGRVTEATVCDHVEPHRGSQAKFWAGPFQSLCASCHSGAKQSEDRTRVRKGCDAQGNPIDANSHWNR